MRAAEVAADDVRLALAAVEEPAGFGGELGLVTRAAVHGQTPLEVGVDQLVGVQLGRVGGQEVQLDPVRMVGEPVADLAGAVGGVSVQDEVDSGSRGGPGSGT